MTMESLSSVRESVRADQNELQGNEARIGAITEALSLGFAAACMVRYPADGSVGMEDMEVAAMRVRAALFATPGVRSIIMLRPSTGLSEAYGFDGHEADELMLFMTEHDPAVAYTRPDDVY